jgi:hypothetical protein
VRPGYAALLMIARPRFFMVVSNQGTTLGKTTSPASLLARVLAQSRLYLRLMGNGRTREKLRPRRERLFDRGVNFAQ